MRERALAAWWVSENTVGVGSGAMMEILCVTWPLRLCLMLFDFSAQIE